MKNRIKNSLDSQSPLPSGFLYMHHINLEKSDEHVKAFIDVIVYDITSHFEKKGRRTKLYDNVEESKNTNIRDKYLKTSDGVVSGKVSYLESTSEGVIVRKQILTDIAFRSLSYNAAQTERFNLIQALKKIKIR